MTAAGGSGNNTPGFPKELRQPGTTGTVTEVARNTNRCRVRLDRTAGRGGADNLEVWVYTETVVPQ